MEMRFRIASAVTLRAVEHVLAQGAQVVPPNTVGILLDMARRGSRDAVRHDGRAQDLARGRPTEYAGHRVTTRDALPRLDVVNADGEVHAGTYVVTQDD